MFEHALRPLPDDGNLYPGATVRAHHRQECGSETGIVVEVGRRDVTVRWTSGRVGAVPINDVYRIGP